MITRVAAALVGLAIVVPAVAYGGLWAVTLLSGAAVVLSAREYARMAAPEAPFGGFLTVAGGSAALFALLVFAPPPWHAPGAALLLVAVFLAVMARPGADLALAAAHLGRFAVGIAWIGGFLAFLPKLRALDGGLAWVFLALVIPWLGDTGGYFTGRLFGRHQMAPVLSPKKTWEGLLGGLLLTTAGVFAVRAVSLPSLSVGSAVILGVGLGLFAALGDLAESLLKRAYGVKDSGNFMPGHGGLLDRIDSLLFVAPLLYAWAVMVEGKGA